MLYRLTELGKHSRQLEPLPFHDLGALQKVEKDLEELLARSLLEVLFESAPLMPIFQERNYKSEADLYALNEFGDLVIFELKRGMAGADAMNQILGYAQRAGQWTFNQLADKFGSYHGGEAVVGKPLSEAHQEGFLLERPLLPSQFNRKQHLYVIGSAANDELINAVDYWKRQGLSVEFIPYRIYGIGQEHYFEFFSLPYDRHQNPGAIRGLLFDTNRSYNEDSIWQMMDKSRVAAYGDTQYVIEYLRPKDIIFYSHKYVGLIAAAEVLSSVKKDGPDEQYRDVRFLTPKPNRQSGIGKYMSFATVSQLTGKSFFWARTIKVPYLDRIEAKSLLTELNRILNGGT